MNDHGKKKSKYKNVVNTNVKIQQFPRVKLAREKYNKV